jgi:fucose permease
LTYNRNLVFTASCVVIFLFGVSLITLGATLPQLSAEFDLTEINKGTLASMLPLGILIGSLVFGPVVDKYSYKYFLAANVFLIVLGFLIIYISSTFLHLAIAFVIIGTGGGSLNGASSSLVSDFSDDHKENKGSNLSTMGAFFGLGALGMPLLLNLLSTKLDYREIIGGVGLTMIIPIIFLLVISYPASKQSSSISIPQIKSLVKDSTLLLLAFILFFESGWESLLNNWLTTYLIDSKSIMEARALGFLTFFIAIFTIGRFLVGVLLKRFVPAIVLALSSVIALAGCIILTFSSSEVITYLALSLAGFGLAAAFPVVLGTIGDRFAKWSGTAFGVALTIALLGNMFINYLTGIVTESYGMTSYAWMVIVSGLFTLLLIALSLRRFSER